MCRCKLTRAINITAKLKFVISEQVNLLQFTTLQRKASNKLYIYTKTALTKHCSYVLNYNLHFASTLSYLRWQLD